MYRIEKFLIDRGMKLKRRYKSGCLVYQDCDDDGFYGVDEVILFPKHPQKPCWEISTGYPYLLTVSGDRDVSPGFIEDCKSTLEEHLNGILELNERLKSIENPWEKE